MKTPASIAGHTEQAIFGARLAPGLLDRIPAGLLAGIAMRRRGGRA